MDGKARQEAKAQEAARSHLDSAVEWALAGAVSGYDSIRDGHPIYVARVVVRSGVFIGRAREGYAEALENAYHQFAGGN